MRPLKVVKDKLAEKFAANHSVDGWITLWYTVEVVAKVGEPIQFLVVPFAPLSAMARKDGTWEMPVVGTMMSFRAALALAERLNQLQLPEKAS